jgi:hypothetical protein
MQANMQEPDDVLHNPDPRRDRKNDTGGTIFTARGMANLGCLAVLFFGLLVLLWVSASPLSGIVRSRGVAARGTRS